MKWTLEVINIYFEVVVYSICFLILSSVSVPSDKRFYLFTTHFKYTTLHHRDNGNLGRLACEHANQLGTSQAGRRSILTTNNNNNVAFYHARRQTEDQSKNQHTNESVVGAKDCFVFVLGSLKGIQKKIKNKKSTVSI